MDDEYFCDNINRTLPSALLNHELPTPIANPNPAPSFPDCPNGNTYPTPLPTNTVTTNGRPTTSTNDSELVADLATTNYSRASLSLAVLAVLLTIALI